MQRELKILLSSSALFILAGGLFGPIYAVFVENIGGDLLTAGGAYSAFAIASGVIIFILGRWEDRVKHMEKLVVTGYFLRFIGFAGYLFIRTPIDLFIIQVILGIGESVMTPAFDGLYSKHLDSGKYASEWGAWESMQWIVMGVGAVAGGAIASIYGFNRLFIIMAIFSFGGLIISSMLLVSNKKRFFNVF